MALALIGTFTSGETGAGGTLSTGSRTSTAGSLITVHGAAYLFGSAPAAITLADNKSNSFTAQTAQAITSGSDNTTIRTAYNVAGTRGTSHTCSVAGNTTQTVSALEWSGVGPSPTVVTANANGSSSAPSVSVSAGAPSGYIGTVTYTGTSTTIAPNGATEASETDENSDFQAQATAYRTSLTGSNSVAWTLGASRVWGASVLAFTEDVGGPGARQTRGPFGRRGPQPRSTRSFTSAVGTTNLTLDIDTAGSIALAGQSVTPNLGLAISTQGAISLAGQSVTPKLGLAISTQGAISLAGQSAAFAFGLPLSNGAITFAGQTLTLTLGTVLSISTPGSVTLAGQSVAFSSGLPLGNGTITIAGQTITLTLGSVLSISTPGAMTLAGQSLTFKIGLAVSNGAVGFAGQSVTPKLSLALSNGSVGVAGQSATFKITTPISGGAITLAGQIVTFNLTGVVVVAISGQTASAYGPASITISRDTDTTVNGPDDTTVNG